MYIDEKLIEILKPYKGETIDVSCVISLIKTVAKEHETEQLRLLDVSKSLDLVELERKIDEALDNEL